MHAPAPNALVVTTDRAAVDAFYRPRIVGIAICLALIVVLAAALVVLVASSSSAAFPVGWLNLVIALTLIGTSTVQLAVLSRVWRRMRAIDVRVAADDAGLRAVLPDVDVLVPWSAVHHARLQGTGPRHRMTIDVDAAAVVGALPDAQRRRIARRGLMLSAVGMRPGLDAVAHAIVVGTQGRVRPTVV